MEEEDNMVMNCLLSMSSKLPVIDQGDGQYWNYQDGEQTIVLKFSDNEEYQVVTQNVSEGGVTVTDGNIVMMENTPLQPYSVGDINFVNPSLPSYSQTEKLIPIAPIAATANDSSSSESVDVEVEDSDHLEHLRNRPPEIITPTKKVQPRRRVLKRTKGWLKTKRENKETQKKKGKGVKPEAHKYNELTELEDNAEQVACRFEKGCECDTNCFEGFIAEKVFRHRLNIADLTKAEHDMYLMGVIHTSMQNPEETCRKKERLRMRSSYGYHGKRVCLTAFLYLEHVTLYQMKRLRKHLQNHGVTPRIHGNQGRKPSNTLPLDIYQHATNFVRNFIQQHEEKPKNGRSFYRLPADCTKKTLHDEYRRYCAPSAKIMQYSTFTNFFKKQFPNVKFRKIPERRVEERKTEEDCEERIRKRFKKRISNVNMGSDTMSVSESVCKSESVIEDSKPYVIVRSDGGFEGNAPLFVQTTCDDQSEVVVETAME